MTSLLTTWEKDPTTVPRGPLGIIAMAGCEELGEKEARRDNICLCWAHMRWMTRYS